MSPPPAPPVHSHSDGTCPITGASGSNPHAYCPPQPGDSRAPCPALNSLANHGYLPRDGKQINAEIIIAAMRTAFNLSHTLAFFLTRGATFILGQKGKYFCLADLARHNRVEHDASIYHEDACPREIYAPITISHEMLKEFFKDSKNGVWITPEDVGRTRVRREATYPNGIKFIQAEVARGEMAIALNMFNNPNPELAAANGVDVAPVKRNFVSRFFRGLLGKKEEPTPLPGVPIESFRTWMGEERLPDGWKPYHTTTLWQTIKTVNRMKAEMKKAKTEAKAKQAAGCSYEREKDYETETGTEKSLEK